MAVVAVRIVAPGAPLRLWLLACVCSALPDADSFLGQPYASAFGHRGFFHSLFFAALLAGACAFWMRSERPFLRTWALLFAVGASHGVLDAMTDGGLGIAFFAPFRDTRYFLPWRPLVCPPIEIGPFFSEWGIRVMKSEVQWVWAPLLALLLIVRMVQGSRTHLR